MSCGVGGNYQKGNVNNVSRGLYVKKRRDTGKLKLKGKHSSKSVKKSESVYFAREKKYLFTGGGGGWC
jgi:hypothetical protein